VRLIGLFGFFVFFLFRVFFGVRPALSQQLSLGRVFFVCAFGVALRVFSDMAYDYRQPFV